MSFFGIVTRRDIREAFNEAIYGGNPNRYEEITAKEAKNLAALLAKRPGIADQMRAEFAKDAITGPKEKPVYEVPWGKYFVTKETADAVFGPNVEISEEKPGRVRSEPAPRPPPARNTTTTTVTTTTTTPRNESMLGDGPSAFRPGDSNLDPSMGVFRPGDSALGDGPFAFRPGDSNFSLSGMTFRDGDSALF